MSPFFKYTSAQVNELLDKKEYSQALALFNELGCKSRFINGDGGADYGIHRGLEMRAAKIRYMDSEPAQQKITRETFAIKGLMAKLGIREDQYQIDTRPVDQVERDKTSIYEVTVRDRGFANLVDFLTACTLIKRKVDDPRCREYLVATSVNMQITGCHDYHLGNFTSVISVLFKGVIAKLPSYRDTQPEKTMDFTEVADGEAFRPFVEFVDKCRDNLQQIQARK